MKHLITTLRNHIGSLPNFWNDSQIHLVHDGYDWVLKEITQSMAEALWEQTSTHADASAFFFHLKNHIIHFNGVTPPQHLVGNKQLMTWYHVPKDDPRLNQLTYIASILDFLHTPSHFTKKTLVDAGFPAEKIVVLPAGIDLKKFAPLPHKNEEKFRSSLGINKQTFVIGSFQKDGTGWGDGMDPKLIKGPDVFCDVVRQLATSYNIHILLSGPARGYVKHRLEIDRIPFTHRFVKTYSDMNRLYRACDAYLISSRIEGIPMAMLEAWATKTPLVSTRVGMVVDVAKHGENALLADVEDRDTLARNMANLIEDEALRIEIKSRAFQAVQAFDWKKLIHFYFERLYHPLITQLN
jgi:glycosyltransferase involved in cell wall biosynthesis